MRVSHVIRRYDIAQLAVLLVMLCLIVVLASGCGPKELEPREGEMALTVSSLFQEGGKIPAKYTCDGEDISPPLRWSEPPVETQSFALIVDDLDAPGGVFTHWVLFNVPSDSRELPEAVPVQAQLSNGALQGKNDFGGIGYGSPCPPPGSSHRYRFTLYALSQPLDSKAGASNKQIADAMQGHILAQGQLIGVYQR